MLVEFPPVLDVVWLALFWLALAWALTLLGFAVFGRRTLLAVEIVGAASARHAPRRSGRRGVRHRRRRAGVHRHRRHRRTTDLPAGGARHHERGDQHDGAVHHAAVPALRPVPDGRARSSAWCSSGSTLGIGCDRRAMPSAPSPAASCHLIVGSPGGNPDGRARQRRSAPTRRPDRRSGPDADAARRCRPARGSRPRRDRCSSRSTAATRGTASCSPAMWLHLWYRDTRRSVRLKRSEYVEHEGFMTFLAARSGLRVPEVVTAGKAENGDALIVARPVRQVLEVDDISLTETEIDLALGSTGGRCTGRHRPRPDRPRPDRQARRRYGRLRRSVVVVGAGDRRRLPPGPGAAVRPVGAHHRRGDRRRLRHAPRSAIPIWPTCFPTSRRPPCPRSCATRSTSATSTSTTSASG